MGASVISSDHFEERHTVLLGRLCLFAMGISLVYILIDIWQTNFALMGYHTVPFVMSTIAFTLNRKGIYYLAIGFVNIGVNLTVYLFASSGYETAFIIYIPVCVSVLLFYGYEQRRVGVAFTLLSVFLFVIGEYLPYEFIDLSVLPQWYKSIIVPMNFVIAIGCVMVIIFFMIKSNYLAYVESDSLNKKLEKNRQKLDLAIKGANSGLWEWDSSTDAIQISASTSGLLRYPNLDKKVLNSRQYLAKVHSEDRPLCLALIDDHQDFELELRIKGGDEQYRWYLKTGLVNENLEDTSVVGTLTDIHHRKLMEATIHQEAMDLKEDNAKLDSILHSTTHDIKGPLSSISALVELSNYSNDITEIKSNLNLIKTKAQHLDGFVQDMLNMSYNANTELSLESTDLNDLIQSELHQIQNQPDYKKINFEVKLPQNLVVNVDQLRLRIVLKNLISNAAKYNNGESSAFVKIHACVSEGQLIIDITDNGIGIEEDQIEKVFGLFYRATSARSGSGVGLHLVGEAIKKMQGKITVESTLRIGSHFRLSIPV